MPARPASTSAAPPTATVTDSGTPGGMGCDSYRKCAGNEKCEAGRCTPAKLVKLHATDDTLCVQRDDGEVVCWAETLGGFAAGDPLGSALGEAADAPAPPHRIAELAKATSLGGRDGEICVVLGTGSVRCVWKDRTHGFSAQNPVTTIEKLEDAVMVRGGSGHLCALRKSGRIACWGDNAYGSGGRAKEPETVDEAVLPLDVPNVTDAEEVACGTHHTCARIKDGSVLCWGWNMRGQLGDGSAGGSRAKAMRVKGFGPKQRAVSIAAGINFSCAALADGKVKCWGGNTGGQIGIGSLVDSPLPRIVPGVSDVVQVSAAMEQVCARTNAGKLSCWGGGIRRFFGPLAAAGKAKWKMNESDDPLNQTKPLAIDFPKPITHVSLGQAFGCVLADDATVACFGQLDGVAPEQQRHGPTKDRPPFGFRAQDFRHAEM